MASKPMCLLLIGKTGYGKSSTGNSLLNSKDKFKKSGNTTSVTKTVEWGEAQFGGYMLKVIDGPGMQDTDSSNVQDKETAITKMEEALVLCGGGVNAFILVIKYGDRFTHEDKAAVDGLKSIIGDKFLSHVIVVMTNGDTFARDYCVDSFDEWCQNQTGGFNQLYEDCGRRIVLFNNYEENESKKRAQTQRVVKLVETINTKHGRYTHECFKNAETKREKMFLELEAPQLLTNYRNRIGRLCSDMEDISRGEGCRSEGGIRKSLQNLRREIQDKDKGHGVLKQLFGMVDSANEHLDDVVKILRLRRDIAAARAKNEVATGAMAPLLQVSAEADRLNPKLGLVMAAGSLAGTGIAKIVYSVKEAKLQQELERRKDQMEQRRQDLGNT